MNEKKLKNNNFSSINTIIFDFGNVLLDIDINLTVQEFIKLGIANFKVEDIHPNNSGAFLDAEIGAISPTQFINILKGNSNVNENSIIDAWNKLLLPYDYSRFELLLNLRKSYKICLLSNTNKLHHDYFEQIFNLNNPFKLKFDDFFDFKFYSDELLCRKPDKIIYQKVENITGIEPQKTLFIDDNQPNLIEPHRMGWNT